MTDWPMFWAQIIVGVGTLVLAGASVYAAFRAVGISRTANELSEASATTAAASLRRETEANHREQASKIWVSMIVVMDPRFGEVPTHGVLLIRNSSDRPISDVTVESRGWSKAQQQWFAKETCALSVAYPGDTTVASRTSKTDWDIPIHHFPHLNVNYNHAGGPRGDPHYVLVVTFTDADGRAWELRSGHRLTRVVASV